MNNHDDIEERTIYLLNKLNYHKYGYRREKSSKNKSRNTVQNQKLKKNLHTRKKKKKNEGTKNTKLLTTQNTLIHLIINLTRR